LPQKNIIKPTYSIRKQIMVNTISVLREVRANWSRVLAFTWLHQEVLEDLRKNPKQTITNLATGGKYKNLKGEVTIIDVDSTTATAASVIKKQSDDDPGEAYRGYLPIPNPLGGLEGITQANLAALLKNGITGILKFDDKADLWADELHAAWNDPEKLKNIRLDPLTHLLHTDDLLKTTYGIFPVPDRPDALKDLGIEELSKFLGGERMSHLGGIFLLGS
jgi:hypothetical protein